MYVEILDLDWRGFSGVCVCVCVPLTSVGSTGLASRTRLLPAGVWDG